MKRLFPLALAILMLLAGCSQATSSSETTTAPPTTSETTTLPPAPEAGSAHEGQIGDYYVAITGFGITKDYDGDDAIVVQYDFTNKGSETISAFSALYISAFQDGIELEVGIVDYDDPLYDDDNAWKEIKPGATLDCIGVFKLRNMSSAVEVEFETLDMLYTDATGVTETFDLGKATSPTTSKGTEMTEPDIGNTEPQTTVTTTGAFHPVTLSGVTLQIPDSWNQDELESDIVSYNTADGSSIFIMVTDNDVTDAWMMDAYIDGFIETFSTSPNYAIEGGRSDIELTPMGGRVAYCAGSYNDVITSYTIAAAPLSINGKVVVVALCQPSEASSNVWEELVTAINSAKVSS